MSVKYQKQIETLAEVMQTLANVGPGDQDLIAQAGAKLEDAIEGFGTSSQLTRLVELAWEGIKHIYSKDEYFMTVRMATLQAVNTIREYALTNGDMEVREFERACENMVKALKGDGESADKVIELPEGYEPAATAPVTIPPVDTDALPVSPPPTTVDRVTLDEVNAAFMRLDVETLTPDSLREFYHLLESAADQMEDEVGQLLQEAVVALTEAPDPETMMTSVGQKLEEASEAKMMLEFAAASAGNSSTPSRAEEVTADSGESDDELPSGPETTVASATPFSAPSAEQSPPGVPAREPAQTRAPAAELDRTSTSAKETAVTTTAGTESAEANGHPVQPASTSNDASAGRVQAGGELTVPAGMEVGTTPDFEIPADADTEMLQEFYTECSELIGIAEEALLDLENNPDDDELINQVFRAFHTMKGTAAFLGLAPVSEFAHYVETVLMMVREDQLGYTNQCADMTLDSLDTIKLMIEEVPTLEPGKMLHIPPAYDSLIARLKYVEAHGQFAEGDTSSPAVSQQNEQQSPAASESGDTAGTGNRTTAPQSTTGSSTPGSQQAGPEAGNGESVQAASYSSETEDDDMDDWSEPSPSDAASTDAGKNGNGLSDNSANGASRTNGAAKAPKNESEGTVRVNTERLDRLIDMVGELVIAHSVVAQDQIVASDSDLLRKVTHSSKILRELQDISLKLRMVPLKSTFQKMNRLVRDISRKAGKQVAFHTTGDDTEIDRNMVDVISEPLVHMLRNSLDHGVETPEQRRKVGKNPVANVYLRAFQQGGKVVIEIEDDGKGLNTEKIYAKALEKDLVEPNRKYTDHEIHNFIFLPGFSTVDVVTDLSGRGVGMDVVRRSIDKLQGKVDVSSSEGMGTLVSLELPFTLAITDGMLVRVGEQRFIIPTINIDMTFRPEESANFTILGSSENVMFRGSSIPVIRLHQMFNVPGAAEEISDGVLMVINSNRKKYALLIDEVLGQQHLVGKSIKMPVKLQNISGGAILGDGRVGLILDTVALVN